MPRVPAVARESFSGRRKPLGPCSPRGSQRRRGGQRLSPCTPRLNVALFTASALCAEWRTGHVFDSPDFTAEGDHVRRVPDEVERCRSIQAVHQRAEGPVLIDLNKRPGVRQGGSTVWVSDLEIALRERVKQ